MKIVPIIFLIVFIVAQAPALAQKLSNYDKEDSEAFIGQDSTEEFNEEKRDSVNYTEGLGRKVAPEKRRDKRGTVVDMGGEDVLFIDGEAYMGQDSAGEFNEEKRDSAGYNESLDRKVAPEKRRNKRGKTVKMGDEDVLIIDGRAYMGQDSPEELNKEKRDSVDYNESL